MNIKNINEITYYDTFPEWIGQISQKNVEEEVYQDMLMKMTRFYITQLITQTLTLNGTRISVSLSENLTIKNIIKIAKELNSRFDKIFLNSKNNKDVLLDRYDAKLGKPKTITLFLFTE